MATIMERPRAACQSRPDGGPWSMRRPWTGSTMSATCGAVARCSRCAPPTDIDTGNDGRGDARDGYSDGDPPQDGRSPGPSTVRPNRRERATAPIEDIWCEKIRGCSYRGRRVWVGRSHKSRFAVRPTQYPYAHRDQVPQCSAMTRCAMSSGAQLPPTGVVMYSL